MRAPPNRTTGIRLTLYLSAVLACENSTPGQKQPLWGDLHVHRRLCGLAGS